MRRSVVARLLWWGDGARGWAGGGVWASSRERLGEGRRGEARLRPPPAEGRRLPAARPPVGSWAPAGLSGRPWNGGSGPGRCRGGEPVGSAGVWAGRGDGGMRLWPATGREPADGETPARCVPGKAAWPRAGWLLPSSVPWEPLAPLRETAFVGCRNFHRCSELVVSGLLRFFSVENTK